MLFAAPSSFFAQDAAQMGWTFDHILGDDLDKAMLYKGDFQDGVRWKDNGGEQTLFVSYDENEKENKRDIYVYQYQKAAGKISLVWDIKDFSGALCSETFVVNSLQLADIDQDGLVDPCFMYQNLCDGLDPTVTKMMLMTKGKKLAIRGLFAVEDQAQIERIVDPVLDQHPAAFKNFMLMNWDEFKSAEFEYSKMVKFKTKDLIVLEKEYLMASGGISYELFDANLKPIKLPAAIKEKIDWSSTIDLMPDGKTLLYGGLKGIGTFDVTTMQDNSYMTFFEDTDAISEILWSPDKTKIAFTALNNEQYPLKTKVFVLYLDGIKMLKKEKFDLPLFYMAAADWVVEAPRFEGNNKLSYEERVIIDGESQPGPKKLLELK